MKEVKGDWALCKEAALNKSQGPKETKALDSFKPKSFNVKREAKELDTFLWNMERYFKYLKLEDDESKISTATLFLADYALNYVVSSKEHENRARYVLPQYLGRIQE